MAEITLGMIVRNEARTIEALLSSVAPHVDKIIIGLAGESTDGTNDIIADWMNTHELVKNGQTVFELLDVPWTDDFAEARNRVHAKVDTDYFLWLDGDDIIINGDKMRAYIQQYPEVDAFYMGYDYARDDQGHNTCFLIRERLVKNPQRWSWKGKVHEVLIPDFPPNVMHVGDIVVQHHKPADKHDPRRNLNILYQQLEDTEPEPDPRILAYLGSENAAQGNLQEAILHWNRYIKLSGWPEEKYQMMLKISTAHRALGNSRKSLDYAFEAMAFLPEWPDSYFHLAKTYSSEPLKNYKMALEWLKIGVSKPKPETALIINPLEYTYEPLLLTAICHAMLGDNELALHHYEQAYKIYPDDLTGQQVQLLRAEMDIQRVRTSFLTLREYLGRHDEWIKVRNLFEALPKSLEGIPEILDAWDRTNRQTGHIEDPQIMVDFYRSNPHWQSMPEEEFLKPEWLKYPRMAFALSVANRVGAESIIDWGCSDGFISIPLARETGAETTGYDLDPRCVSLANERSARLGIDARFEEGNVESVRVAPTQKADLAIFFEVLEHVVEPEETLGRLEASAKHIAITTPYLAWEGGNIPAWDRDEPKGHLRIFGLEDIEVLLTGRGKIDSLYKEAWGSSGWIFADYSPGVRYDKNVAIVAPGSLEAWGPRKLAAAGLGGSETAAIRLAEELAELGHRTFIYNRNDDPGYFNGVCYRDGEKFQPAVRSDLCIAWRYPELADFGVNTARLVLWMHDTDAADRLTEQRAERFHSIVVLSQWHKEHMMRMYPFIPEEKFVIIGNGVDLERFSEAVPRKDYKVVYSSSPDRGLDIILEHIWPRVVEEVPQAELHLYYGWESFDRASDIPGWESLRDYKTKLQQLILNGKNIVQHGRVSQDRLAREMQEAKIWLYPTYFSETYCITAVEAQLAGAIPVTNRLAALAETVRSGIDIQGDVHDPGVQSTYARAVIDLLNRRDYPEFHEIVRAEAPAVSWDSRAREWNLMFLGGGTWTKPVLVEAV